MNPQTATRSLARWTLDRLGSLGPLGGVVVLIWESAAPLPPLARAGGAVGFLLGAFADLIDPRRSRAGVYVSTGNTGRNQAAGIGLIVTLVLAFNCTTRQHHSAQPLWLTLFGIAILAALIGGAVPWAVFVWRRHSDERDRAIANGSMAFALLATVVFVALFSSLKDLEVGPVLRPEWVLYAASLSWFGAWLVLRRRM